MVFNSYQLEQISSFIYRKFGISIEKNKYERLIPKLERMIDHEGYSGADELCSRLFEHNNSECVHQLCRYVTTCHTYFFQEPEHFHIMAEDMRRHEPRTSLIWCAACSTGEEPYSLAMTLLDNGITHFHIVASDINRQVLCQFNKGIYHESRLIQTPPAVRLRYFKPVGNGYYQISSRLREYISIKNMNLMDTVCFAQQFDYVYCRNVFIYFDEKSRRRAVANMTSNLKIGGLLFIGHAEVLLVQPDNLKKAGSSIYCRTY